MSPRPSPAIPPASAGPTGVGEALIDVVRAVWMRGQAQSRGWGLTFPQSRLLSMIGNDGPLVPSALARHVGVSRQAMSSAAGNLERMGMIRRVHRAEDRRQVLVELTSRGRRLWARVRADQHELHLSLDRAITGRERTEALRVLGTIRQELGPEGEPPRYRCSLCQRARSVGRSNS